MHIRWTPQRTKITSILVRYHVPVHAFLMAKMFLAQVSFFLGKFLDLFKADIAFWIVDMDDVADPYFLGVCGH